MYNKRVKQVKEPTGEQTLAEKSNTIRAAVLGANDGILTVVGVLFSVGVATSNQATIIVAGVSDLIACALSMSSGEYASVSSQKDTEQAVELSERKLIDNDFEHETSQVADYYVNRGVSTATANEIAQELMEKKPLETVLRTKHDLEYGHYMDPWQAAFSSMFAAASGGLFPLMAIILFPADIKWAGTILAVLLSVTLTGFLSAKLGDGLIKIAIFRNVIVGIITMFIHFYVGTLL